MTSKSTISVDLNPPQQEAVEHGEGPLLVLAGAGSGKTRVLACRAAYLVHSGMARPYQILALTFTNKAAGELKSRTSAMVGSEGESVVAGTFHSIFARIMRREGLNINIDPRFTIVDADDRRRFIKTILKENNIPIGTVRPAGIDWAISMAKNNLLSPDDLEELVRGPRDKVVVQVYRHYERRLRRMKGLDFDDLLSRPLQAFRDFPDFLQRLQDRFHYVLVDEFQDTNKAQYRLVCEVAGRRRNLCVVGDDDQAIYGFRGATVGNILDFERDWPDVKIIRLEQNYRSCKPILDVAWSVIKNNQHRRSKKLWTARDYGTPVELIETDSDEDEALKVVGYIEEEHVHSNRPYSDIAILYRTNAQSLSFERAFRTAKIPYRIIGGLRFYERKEIKDLLAYLRLIVNPDDDISLLRIINYPPRGIGTALINEIKARARADNLSLYQSLIEHATDPNTAPRRSKALEHFINLITGFRKLSAEAAFSDLVREIILQTGLRQRLQDEEKDDPSRAESKLANIENLQRDIERYVEIYPEGTIETFLEEVTLITEPEEADVDVQGVNLLTLHSAKGLEFDVVFISGLEDGLLPLEPPDGSETNIEEERRLFYVGATRARERLVLTYATDRFRWGYRGGGKPSRFLFEIPEELLRTRSNFSLRKGLSPFRKRSRDRRAERSYEAYSPVSSGTSAANSKLSPDELRNGLLLRHPKFGLGVVVEFHKSGPDSRIDVDFDDAGLKTLVLKYARLEVVK